MEEMPLWLLGPPGVCPIVTSPVTEISVHMLVCGLVINEEGKGRLTVSIGLSARETVSSIGWWYSRVTVSSTGWWHSRAKCVTSGQDELTFIINYSAA